MTPAPQLRPAPSTPPGSLSVPDVQSANCPGTHLAAADPINAVPITPAYAAVQTCFAQHGSAHHYYRDVTHYDRARLSLNPHRFLWLLGHCFTNVLLEANAPTSEILDYRLNERRSGEPLKIFGYANGVLERLDHDQARAFYATLPPPTKVKLAHGLTFLTRSGLTRRVQGQHLDTLNWAQQAASAHLKVDCWDSRASLKFDHEIQALWDQLDPL